MMLVDSSQFKPLSRKKTGRYVDGEKKRLQNPFNPVRNDNVNFQNTSVPFLGTASKSLTVVLLCYKAAGPRKSML